MCVSLVSYFKNVINHGGASAIIVGCGQYYHWAKGLAGKFSGSEVGISAVGVSRIYFMTCSNKFVLRCLLVVIPDTHFWSMMRDLKVCYTLHRMWSGSSSTLAYGLAGITSSWSGGILGKLIVVSLVRKFLASYSVRRFITMLRGARCRSCTSPVESSLYLHAIFVFSGPFYYSLIYVQVFRSDFATWHFLSFSFSPACATCPANVILCSFPSGRASGVWGWSLTSV